GRLAAAWIGATALAYLTDLPLTDVIGLRASLAKIGLCAGLAAAVAVAFAFWPRSDPATPAPASPAPPSLRAYPAPRAPWVPATVLLLAEVACVPEKAIMHGDWSERVRVLVFVPNLAGAGIYALACPRMPLARGARLALLLNLFVVVGFAGAWDQV